MRMIGPSGWAALRSRVRTLFPSDWSKVRWARWTAIMLIVPVAHFWTSASGRDTVTSCEGFTVTIPVNSLPSTVTVRSGENPLKSAGQRAVFSNARRKSSRASGSSWASVGRASLLYGVVIDGLLRARRRWTGFTFADGLIIETRRRFVQFGNCPRCQQNTDRSYMVILTPYYSKPCSDCRLRPIQGTIFFSFIFNMLLSFPQATQPFLRKIFHRPLSFCGIMYILDVFKDTHEDQTL